MLTFGYECIFMYCTERGIVISYRDLIKPAQPIKDVLGSIKGWVNIGRCLRILPRTFTENRLFKNEWGYHSETACREHSHLRVRV